jgi:hypothetical protein
MSICDFLFSADMLVADPRAVVSQMIESIGLPRPGAKAYVDYENEGWDCVFALVNKAWSVGPTRLEVIGPKRYATTPGLSRGQAMSDVQGTRPCKTHATVLATPEIEELAGHVKQLGLRHWFEEASGLQVPFSRLWIGVTEEEPFSYRPEVDDGLIIEVIPSDSAAFDPKLFQRPAPMPIDPEPGQMIRILERMFIVDDLEATARKLERNLRWEAGTPIVDDPEAGYRWALLSRNYEQGAALKLVEPLDTKAPAGAFRAKHGPGPYTIRVAVYGLDAKRADLEARGTRFVERRETSSEPARLCVDPAATGGMPFEFVEFAD